MRPVFGFFRENYRTGWTFRFGYINASNQYIPVKITLEKQKPIDECKIIPEASFLHCSDIEILPLVDALTDALEMAGLRQSPKAAVSELKATKYHLEDMRKLALK